MSKQNPNTTIVGTPFNVPTIEEPITNQTTQPDQQVKPVQNYVPRAPQIGTDYSIQQFQFLCKVENEYEVKIDWEHLVAHPNRFATSQKINALIPALRQRIIRKRATVLMPIHHYINFIYNQILAMKETAVDKQD